MSQIQTAKFLAVLLALVASQAWAQGGPVQQSGPMTPGHVPSWITNGVIGDGGPALNGKVKEFGITNTGTPLCITDGATTAPYHQLCLGANSLGGGLISYNAYAGAPMLPLMCVVNGISAPCFGGGGNVTGPTAPLPPAGRIAIWMGGLALGAPVPGKVCTSGPLPTLVVGEEDPNAGYNCSPTIPSQFIVMSKGTANGIIGEVDNTMPYTTNPFLAVGTTGFGKVPAGVASVAFGLYGLGELYNAKGEAVGGEVTVRNFSGADADNGVPANNGLPTQYAILDGFHITCGTEVNRGAKDCSVGLYIANESGGNPAYPVFSTGEVIQGYRRFGLYIMPGDPSIPSIGAHIEDTGNGVNLELKTTGPMIPSNAVLTVNDAGGNFIAGIYQNGDIHGNDALFSGGTYYFQNINPGSGGTCLGIDASGRLYRSGTGC